MLCTYFETSAAINGLDIDGLEKKRPSLLEACDLFGIPHMTKEHKAEMRELSSARLNTVRRNGARSRTTFVTMSCVTTRY